LFRTILLLFFNHLTALRQFGHKRNFGASEKFAKTTARQQAPFTAARQQRQQTNSWGQQ
jgi:hypothetical protein